MTTVNASLRILRRVLRVAEECGELQKTPKIKMLPGEQHRERVIAPEEEARYLAACKPLPHGVTQTLVRYRHAARGMSPPSLGVHHVDQWAQWNAIRCVWQDESSPPSPAHHTASARAARISVASRWEALRGMGMACTD